MRYWLVLLVGCGTATPTSPAHTSPACTAEPALDACPGDPTQDASCPVVAQRCTAATRICECNIPISGGAPPPPNPPKTWRCAVATRSDGCPGLEPRERSCCDGPAHDCTYAGNGPQDPYVLACKHDTWVVVHLPAPRA